MEKSKSELETDENRQVDLISGMSETLIEPNKEVSELEAKSVSAQDLLVSDSRDRYLEDTKNKNARINYGSAHKCMHSLR